MKTSSAIKYSCWWVRCRGSYSKAVAGLMVLFCIMKETKSTETIEMLFAGLPPFYSAIRWKWFLITSEQLLNRMTDPKVNMALYSPIAGSFSHSSNVDIITSIFYRCPKWYAMLHARVCGHACTWVCVLKLKADTKAGTKSEMASLNLSQLKYNC